VRLILRELRLPVYRACLSTIYACGLRLLEGARLQVPDVDSGRMLLHIHGKSKKDRYVPLPEPTLDAARSLAHASLTAVVVSGADPHGWHIAWRTMEVRSRAAVCRVPSARRSNAVASTSGRMCIHCAIPTPPICWKLGSTCE
jgi:Site-specific recombinase XerD